MRAGSTYIFLVFGSVFFLFGCAGNRSNLSTADLPEKTDVERPDSPQPEKLKSESSGDETDGGESDLESAPKSEISAPLSNEESQTGELPTDENEIPVEEPESKSTVLSLDNTEEKTEASSLEPSEPPLPETESAADLIADSTNVPSEAAPIVIPLIKKPEPAEEESPEADAEPSVQEFSKPEPAEEESPEADAEPSVPELSKPEPAEPEKAVSVENTAPAKATAAAALPILSDTIPKSESESESDPASERLLKEPGEMTIVLDGTGWIFRSDLSDSGNWVFKGRTMSEDATEFQFLFKENGQWKIYFQKQNPATGSDLFESESVRVGNENSPVSGKDSFSEDSALLMEDGNIGDVLKILEDEAERPGEQGARARAALVEKAAQTGSVAPLVTWLPSYIKDNPDPEVLAQALSVFEKQPGYDEEEKMLLEELIRRTDDENRTPGWIYRLASKMEEIGSGRDIDRAAALYQKILNDWPFSDWRNKAEERLSWLQRYYFRIR